MSLKIAPGRLIGDIQNEFNTVFPFLKLEFFKMDEVTIPSRRLLPACFALQDSRLQPIDGHTTINEKMTVLELENEFLSLFGLGVQVLRKSGNLWLETTMTDNWTLQRQNELGREISVPLS